jgi:aerobic carbon-monoxide dehydrogenase medium subunit
MIRTRLRYHRPSTPAEASAVLAEHAGTAAVLGGGTQLLPRMNRAEVHVEHVVDLRDLGLDTIAVRDAGVEIGASVTYDRVLASTEIAATVPLLARVARGVTGGRQLTQQATLVGALCHNHPGTDMTGPFTALDARLRLHGPESVREVAVADFLLAPLEVDLRPGEFVTGAHIPATPRAGYCKVKHSTGSWPIATATAVRGAGGVTVTLGAVQAVPLTVRVGGAADVRAAVRDAVTDPWSDVLAPASYRAAIAGVVASRALAELEEMSG